MSSPEVDAAIDDLLRAISDIDFHHKSDLNRIEQNVADEELKSYLISSKQYEYQLNRQPYVDLLNKLRRQQYRHAS
jgi:hypothetical protein